ncbi:MAG: four helix bundle protein [Stygiobacter sp.]
MNEIYFDHEKLNVYQKAIEFIEWLENIINRNAKKSILDQIERAANSILLNIAEGNGKFTGRDKCRYFDIARGSALECAASLDIMFRKDIIKYEELIFGKNILKEIVSMLIGLIKANSDRVYDENINYDSND